MAFIIKTLKNLLTSMAALAVTLLLGLPMVWLFLHHATGDKWAGAYMLFFWGWFCANCIHWLTARLEALQSNIEADRP